MIAREQILEVARANAGKESDPEVARVLDIVLAHGGDLSLTLSDLFAEPSQFGTGGRLLDNLVDQTFEALLGDEELVDRLEQVRRKLLGSASLVIAGTGGVGAAALWISSATGLQVVAAAVVFLYLLPIGVRAAFETWKTRGDSEA